jgi:hypothetical protein
MIYICQYSQRWDGVDFWDNYRIVMAIKGEMLVGIIVEAINAKAPPNIKYFVVEDKESFREEIRKFWRSRWYK